MPMVPFKYGGFWDVPRYILCRVEENQLLLEAGFDDALDEYSTEYRVYALPPGLDWDSIFTWLESPSSQSHYLGSIPVNEIHFDESKRKEIETGPLIKLIRH
ncbi:MAG: hypothetical protein ABSF28_22150 [Terracidiphilus sp.]|jgi:hypothetical protein